MLPHAGVGGWTPKPRKLIAASATMNEENWRLATTMIDGAREEVAAELGGAGGVAGRARGPEALDEVGRERVVGGEPRRQEGGRERRRGEADPEPLLQGSRTRGSSQP